MWRGLPSASSIFATATLDGMNRCPIAACRSTAMIGPIIRVALRALRVNTLRAVLTMLG